MQHVREQAQRGMDEPVGNPRSVENICAFSLFLGGPPLLGDKGDDVTGQRFLVGRIEAAQGTSWNRTPPAVD
jgi:hypothetical protein